MKIDTTFTILTLAVVAISGNPAVYVFGREVAYVALFAVFLALWLLRSVRLTYKDKLSLGFFALLVTVQISSFGLVALKASIGFMITLGIALLAVRLIPEFQKRFVQVMYAISLVSFPFFIPRIFGVDMQRLFNFIRIPLGPNSIDFHIGVFNLRDEYDGIIRNMSMFWEPGAFAGYLVLALLFLIRDGKSTFRLSRQGLVLIVALLSTQSTTGYLTLMALIIYYLYKSDWAKRTTARLFFLPVLTLCLIGAVAIAINEFAFLGEKISIQLEEASRKDDFSRLNRFGNFLYDVEWIAQRPILGWSATPETRVLLDPEVAELLSGQGNGLTGFTVKFGLSGLLVYLLCVFSNTRRLTGSLPFSLFTVGIVSILLNGEQFLNYPLFLSLIFDTRNKVMPLTGRITPVDYKRTRMPV
ncbi:MAG: O-antigen ligase family protein [Glaciimonas sp.]|nr:O-antigen ligase family protein [Glaciimonas sp.]